MISAFWHRCIISATWYWRDRGAVVMNTTNFDGQWTRRVIEHFGFGTAQGSSTRGGLRGLAVMARRLEEGHDAAFTIDGPRGPRYVAKPGPVMLARRTGKPILPISHRIGARTDARKSLGPDADSAFLFPRRDGVRAADPRPARGRLERTRAQTGRDAGGAGAGTGLGRVMVRAERRGTPGSAQSGTQAGEPAPRVRPTVGSGHKGQTSDWRIASQGNENLRHIDHPYPARAWPRGLSRRRMRARSPAEPRTGRL